MKVSVIYWSGTGNTEMMADAVARGAAAEGCEVEILQVDKADKSVTGSDVILFGCPAMGCEVLEESEFEPFFASIENSLSGKTRSTAPSFCRLPAVSFKHSAASATLALSFHRMDAQPSGEMTE